PPPLTTRSRTHQRHLLTPMRHAQLIDEAPQRNLAPGPDRFEQIADRQFAKTFLLPEPDVLIARLEGKNVGRLLYPAALEEQHDLLLAQPLDVERAPGNEMLQMLDFLERAGELAAAARNRSLLARRGRLAHHRALQRARAAGGKF